MNTPNGLNTKRKSLDIDLNLAPVIDCFTVLIIFLLVSASFLATGILGVGAQISTQNPTEVKNNQTQVEVTLLANKTLDVKAIGKFVYDSKIPQKNGSWDLSSLNDELIKLKNRAPEIQQLIVSAQDDVEYSQVIEIIASAKKALPDVYLGGF